MDRRPIQAKSYQALKEASRPSNPNQPEAFADVLYDIREYVDNTTLELPFFRTAQNSPNLNNLTSSGQLPAGNFFAIDHITIDVWAEAGFVTTAAGGLAGAANDVGLLMVFANPTIKLNLNSKPYGPWPALAAGGSGKVDVFINGTFTAEEQLQVGQNAPGGLYIGQSIIIPPLTAFDAVMTWQQVADLTDDYLVRVGLHGTRYRPVV